MKHRLFSAVFKLSGLLFAGLLYYIIILMTGFKIPCLFNSLTGLLCPGCGITRMILSIFRLDFFAAYGYNKALFVTLLPMLIILLAEEIRYIKSGNRKFSRFSCVFFTLEAVFLVLFGIVRNII